MSRIRRALSFLTLLVFVLTTALPALAAPGGYEDVMAESMRGALTKTGMPPGAASNVAQQNLFFGIVMLKDVQRQLLGGEREREKLLVQAERVGTALGTALGSALNAYGGKKMQETPAVMMHAVRAGMVPEAAAETFSVLTQNGYAFDAAKQVIHEASEVVRSEKLADAGAGLCRGIRKIAAQKGPVQELQKEIVLAAKAEKARQLALLAKNEAERRKRDGGNDASGRMQGRRAGGAAAAGSPSRGTAQAVGTASPAGGAAGKADAGSGSASGANGSGNTSGGNSDANAGGASGGTDGKSGSGSSPGGGSSGGAGDAGSGGASGGKSGSDGASGGNSSASGNAGGAADGKSGGSTGGGASASGGASDGASGSGGSSGQGGNSNGSSGSAGAGASSSGGASDGAAE